MAKRTLLLKVGGAFHSPFMEPLHAANSPKLLNQLNLVVAGCPIYQNVTVQSVNDAEIIKENLIAQLTSPVRWTKIMQNMIADGANNITEVGPGKILQSLFKKVDRKTQTQSAAL